jgi:hypothetical protein
MNETTSADRTIAGNTEVGTAAEATHQFAGDEVLKRGNRQVITDFYFDGNIADEPTKFEFKVFIRLNSRKKVKFERVSFKHCIFDGCYLTHCAFDTCDFTGCRFIGSNFHQSSFAGCNFEYATFERTQIDNDILTSESPREENLRMRFARSLRMNYSQIGDAKAVNKAISLELQATATYLFNSWKSDEIYYRKKYPGLINGVVQFVRWSEFWILDFVWGNGESILKLLRSILVSVIMIAAYDTNVHGNPLTIGFYWSSFQNAAAVFLGVLSPHYYSVTALSIIAGMRFVSIALLTALLVKRFSRR